MLDRTTRPRRVLALAALVALSPGRACLATEAGQASWQGVERVVAFADVHGAYTELAALLWKAGIVDDQLRWSAGRTHVVSLGDLLDRGADSRKVMDLLMRLQGEAAAAGGQLHVVLGNHEAMNVIGDLRYVAAGEFASYVADEPPGQRESLRAAWIASQGPGSAAAFDQRFPPGYFGHRAALAPEGKYGRWLLGLPAAVLVNDTLFMHGGPSKLLAGMDLQEINRRYANALTTYLRSLEELESAGLVIPTDDYGERAKLAAERLAARPAAENAGQMKLADAVQRFTAADRDPWLVGDGPNWYRGTARCNACFEADVLNPIMERLHAKRLVIGHTIARNFRVATRFDGRVVKLDAGMNRRYASEDANGQGGQAAALVIQGGSARVLYLESDGPPADVAEEPLYVGSSTLDDAEVADILANGTVTIAGPRSPGTVDATVVRDGRQVPAVFVTAPSSATRHELAAYRLDRLIRLGLVPATVEREVQGQRGVLQARPARFLNQADMRQQPLRSAPWCAFEPQFQLMYAFDTLIGNEGRTEQSLLFDASGWVVVLTGHDRAFGTSGALPAYLKARPPAPGPEMRRRLAALDAASLQKALGDLLSARERKAILERRDALLSLPAAAAAGR